MQVQHSDDSNGPAEGGQVPAAPRRSRFVKLGAALCALVVVAAAVALLMRDNRVDELVGPRPASASAESAPLMPTHLLSLPHSAVRDGTASLDVTLSASPTPQSPPPTLRPAVAGTWSVVGRSELFTPTSTLEPCATYTLTVWANTTATGQSRLGHRHTMALHVACPSLTAAQQALARLGYLGAKFRPLYVFHGAAGPETRREAAVHAFHPPRGRLAPDPSDAPPVSMGQLDETTRGALTVYQEEHGLQATGEPNYATWASLLSSETTNHHGPQPYTWVSVSESIPETLEVHRGHHVVLSTPANTGVPGAETPQGVFPIYSRLTSTTMSGTDPDGTKYVVPDVPWVNYFNGGDAVHGYPRASYGSPQSNGCVELPIETAQRVFEMLRLGDIVQVT
jgi:peptidoglycan hydrolase-like protein with peptidoglycan-binding domain